MDPETWNFLHTFCKRWILWTSERYFTLTWKTAISFYKARRTTQKLSLMLLYYTEQMSRNFKIWKNTCTCPNSLQISSFRRIRYKTNVIATISKVSRPNTQHYGGICQGHKWDSDALLPWLCFPLYGIRVCLERIAFNDFYFIRDWNKIR